MSNYILPCNAESLWMSSIAIKRPLPLQYMADEIQEERRKVVRHMHAAVYEEAMRLPAPRMYTMWA